MIKDKEDKEIIIEKLTELLINQDEKDKQNKKIECISKVSAYRGLIKFIKEEL